MLMPNAMWHMARNHYKQRDRALFLVINVSHQRATLRVSHFFESIPSEIFFTKNISKNSSTTAEFKISKCLCTDFSGVQYWTAVTHLEPAERGLPRLITHGPPISTSRSIFDSKPPFLRPETRMQIPPGR